MVTSVSATIWLFGSGIVGLLCFISQNRLNKYKTNKPQRMKRRDLFPIGIPGLLNLLITRQKRGDLN